MKKIIVLSAITSSMLLATNGDIMLRDGAKASGMGGVGIAISHGSESLYSNPAMIKDIKNSEFSGYLTMFQPDVNAKTSFGQPTQAFGKSAADQSFIPGFAYVHRNNENIIWGISLAGTAGMGTDYKNNNGTAGAFQMETDLAIAKLSVPIAYTKNDFTIAVAPVLQYSTLQLNYQYQNSPTTFANSDNKKDSSVGLGLTAGLAYDLGNLTLGAEYKSEIETTYKNNISSAIGHFGITSISSGDQLDQPAEFGVGAAYKMDNSIVAIDLRRVNWGEVAGYKDFGWENQTVVAVGYEYATPEWAVRAGYNYGKSPITEQDGSNSNGAKINFFNLVGFPAMVEEHYTVGGDYTLSDNLMMSLAFVYTPETTEKFDISGMNPAAPADSLSAEVKHSQSAITVGASYKF
ncbi:MAG: putative facilitator of salicylate uptake [uncultured Sulfurovum sp.]|uniref:Putative facilitator of salicylate uptake n=1 Tax=uncultured Sulfurovum sp. TaxID=269237 RepID=A0A6S6U7B6_9BACT|nr:MAG: putative facilitator of salicylate uptake [uncultured Sulfurovum sp.]